MLLPAGVLVCLRTTYTATRNKVKHQLSLAVTTHNPNQSRSLFSHVGETAKEENLEFQLVFPFLRIIDCTVSHGKWTHSQLLQNEMLSLLHCLFGRREKCTKVSTIFSSKI